MQFEYEALHAKTQQTLINFLYAELQIGPTFVHAALLAKDEAHVAHYTHSKHNAIKAAASVRRFMSRVADHKVRTEIAGQLEELDRLISTL
jgi:hypothetical protein